MPDVPEILIITPDDDLTTAEHYRRDIPLVCHACCLPDSHSQPSYLASPYITKIVKQVGSMNKVI